MFGALVEYWYYTGDSQWNDITTQALLHQVGPANNYMPPNQTTTLGNDVRASSSCFLTHPHLTGTGPSILGSFGYVCR
jgi:hypothetical protein